MKIYPHLSIEGFSNCYIIGNDETKDAIIIDPGKITKEILLHLEDNMYTLVGVLITHKHKSHYRGLKTLQKIYTPKVFASDFDIAGTKTIIIKDDGIISIAGLQVYYFAVPGHTADSVVFKIEQVLFTGDVLTAGLLGSTSNVYAQRILENNILSKLFAQQNHMVIMPGHGPPSTIGAEKKFNLSIGCPAITELINSKIV